MWALASPRGLRNAGQKECILSGRRLINLSKLKLIAENSIVRRMRKTGRRMRAPYSFNTLGKGSLIGRDLFSSCPEEVAPLPASLAAAHPLIPVSAVKQALICPLTH